MVAELVFVGTELLLGQILNTNAQYLSKKLAELGIDVYRQTVVGDNPERLTDCVRESLGRAELLITTGGLGPTGDDLTKEVVARILGRDLVTDQAALASIEGFFAARGRTMTSNNRKQALIPRGSRALPNHRGTAPGVLVEAAAETGDKLVVMLPGPPRELGPMFEAEVLPHLTQRPGVGQTIVSRVLHLCGIGEAEVADRLGDIIAEQAETTIAPLASQGEVRLRLTTKASSRRAGLARMEPVEREIRRHLGRHVYGVDGQSLPGVVADLLTGVGLRLALAESCTGGLLSSWLTDQPGVSAAFTAGLVVYANQAKLDLLGVPAAQIERHGAVSAEVCAAMATGARRVGRADIGVGITGIAGPSGATASKPVGLVFIGLAAAGAEVAVAQHRFVGDRETIKARAARQALVRLRDHLLDLGPGV